MTKHRKQIAMTGYLTRKLPTKPKASWDDDDAHMLATTFNTLTDSIVRFQRDAAQRERLSSLGRLSTVIAHEVRNPLMIIKGALRRSEEHTSELQSPCKLVCRLLLEKKKKKTS